MLYIIVILKSVVYITVTEKLIFLYNAKDFSTFFKGPERVRVLKIATNLHYLMCMLHKLGIIIRCNSFKSPKYIS